MTRQGFVVEFIGLPGVGKTTLALGVAELLGQSLPVQLAHSRVAGRSWVARRLRNTRDIVGLGLRRPSYSFKTMRAIRASGQRSLYDGLKVTNNWLSVSALTVRSDRTPRVTLFDQGMFQALWSVGYSAEGAGRLERLRYLGTLMPKPDLLVLVSAEPGTVVRRLQTRGGRESRLDGVLHAGAAPLREAATLLDTVVAIARSGGMDLLELDGNDDGALETNVRTVAGAVQTIIQTAPDRALAQGLFPG